MLTCPIIFTHAATGRGEGWLMLGLWPGDRGTQSCAEIMVYHKTNLLHLIALLQLQ